MKRHLLACLTLGAFCFASCSKEDGDGPQAPTQLLTSIESDYFDNLEITYNADKTIKRYHMDPAYYMPKYENGKLKSIYWTNDADDETGRLEMEFTYDAKGRIIKAGIDSLVYNSSNQLIEFHHYPGVGEPVYLTKITWSGGNITKAITIKTEYQDTTVYTYKYDNKRNALTPFAFSAYHTGYHWEYHSKNNATEVIWTSGSGEVEKTLTQYTEYNSDGYPVKATKKEYYNDQLDGEYDYIFNYLPKE